MAKIIELQKLFELYKKLNIEDGIAWEQSEPKDSFKDWATDFLSMPKKRQKQQYAKHFIS